MAIPQNTQIPSGKSQFMKFKQGDNNFRIVSDIITGWEGWKDKKPFRRAGNDCTIKVEEVDLDNFGKPNRKYFWAMVVWNYDDKQIQVLELTQTSIMNTLFNLESNGKWGDLKNYDLTITKKGEKMETEYTIVPNPKEPLKEEIQKAYTDSKVDLSKLFEGEYPMTEDTGHTPYATVSDEDIEEINPSDIPF